MNKTLVSFYLMSASVILLVAGIAKVIASRGNAEILIEPDPILGIPFQALFLCVGVVEIIVALMCLFYRRVELSAELLAWLATNLSIYRLGLLLAGYSKPCGCFGNLTEALHISSVKAGLTMEGILAYLLIGSYAALFWLRQQRKNLSTLAVL
jgi:hypothetical protein